MLKNQKFGVEIEFTGITRRKELSINVIKKLCDGLDMKLGEFFSSPIFDELEQEIR